MLPFAIFAATLNRKTIWFKNIHFNMKMTGSNITFLPE